MYPFLSSSVLADADSGISTGEENVQNKITKFTDDSSDVEQYRKKKKHKHKERKSDVIPENHDCSIGEKVEDEGEVSEISPLKKKKKKSKTNLDNAECSHDRIHDEQEMEIEFPHNVKQKSPAKKKKHKQHDLEVDVREATDVSQVFSKKRKRHANTDETEDISPKKKKRKGNDVN